MIRYMYAGEGLDGFVRRGFRTRASSTRSSSATCSASGVIEEEIERRYHEDQMKTPIHLVIGQEATSVGCCAAL